MYQNHIHLAGATPIINHQQHPNTIHPVAQRYGENYAYVNPLENTCIANQKGCKAYDRANFNPDPTTAPQIDGCRRKIYGCTDSKAWNYNRFANTDYPGACFYKIEKRGCTNPNAFNYDPYAIVDDESCIPRTFGCTDLYAANYDPAANTDDGTCVPFRIGCTKETAKNYDPFATINDGACYFQQKQFASRVSGEQCGCKPFVNMCCDHPNCPNAISGGFRKKPDNSNTSKNCAYCK